ncbi:MAG: TonB-dependent receptor [Nitrospira sp.]|nr:TonB-dependent receptor [Nitrospira sp.]
MNGHVRPTAGCHERSDRCLTIRTVRSKTAQQLVMGNQGFIVVADMRNRPVHTESLATLLKICIGLVCYFASAFQVLAANTDQLPDTQTDLTDLSLEELLNVEVTSVTKQAQPLAQTAAAIFVLTQEDIRRSGATSIPEALRMVPGLQVARLDSNKWAISSRGFNGRFANKLLVLIDGRTVYTPLYSGVFWDVQDTLLEDIDRIEVIRGPGAALWGANAVNGVINVITKKAKDTQGGLLVGGAGTEERGFTGIRYGMPLSDNTHIRAYGKFFARDSQATATGDPATDPWHQARGGMRIDHNAANGDLLTLQGDFYQGEYRERLTSPTLTSPFSSTSDLKGQVTGGNLLGRWTHALSPTSGLTLQMYYDRSERATPQLGEKRDIADIDFQHHLAVSTQHHIVWGLGYRFTNDQLTNSQTIQFSPFSRVMNLWSGFVQDEITVVPKTVALTLGSKIEHNDLSGLVVQPNGRLRWTPTDHQTVWASVSRAVRTPSRAEDDVRINQTTTPPSAATGGLPALATLVGNRGYGNEKTLAYEVGYRNQLSRTLSADVTAFYNNYKDLRTIEPGTASVETTPAPLHLSVPFNATNHLRAETYGVEASVEWHPLDWWRIQPSYTYLYMHLYTDQTTDPTAGDAKGQSPAHQISMRSLMSLPHNIELDLWGRYVDRLVVAQVPSYVTMDVRIGWRPTKQLEFSLVGQNLLDNHRPEFKEPIVSSAPTEIQRSVYGKVTWRF